MAKKEAGKAANKKRGKALKVVLPIFFVLILIGFVTVSLLYNLFSARDLFFKTVYGMDPDYVAVEALEEQLALREAQLDERESKVLSDEERLNGLKEELDEREDELKRRELESLPIYHQPMTEEALADLKAISGIYEQMQPTDAASILASLYSIDDMAAILYYMSEESSAAILSSMDRTIAVEITDTLLHY
jgi:flagellar motility protein MotE (MotC chaperone)